MQASECGVSKLEFDWPLGILARKCLMNSCHAPTSSGKLTVRKVNSLFDIHF